MGLNHNALIKIQIFIFFPLTFSQWTIIIMQPQEWDKPEDELNPTKTGQTTQDCFHQLVYLRTCFPQVTRGDVIG